VAKDPRFVTSKDRVHNRQILTEILHGLTRQFRRADLLPKLDAAAVPAGPINTIGQVFADPHLIARGMRLDLENPNAQKGSTPGVSSPIVMDGVNLHSTRPAPKLGEHDAEILADVRWGGQSKHPSS